MNGVQKEFEGRVTVVSLNVADPDNLLIQQGYGLRGHPSAVVIDANNEVTARYFGPVDEETLRDELSGVAP